MIKRQREEILANDMQDSILDMVKQQVRQEECLRLLVEGHEDGNVSAAWHDDIE